jgi:hypothetical protein
MSTLAHAVIMTTEGNGWPKEVAIMTLGWIAHAGGDYKQPADEESMLKMKAIMEDVAADFANVLKEVKAYQGREDAMVRTPLAVKENNLEYFVLALVESQGLHPAIAMQVLGCITYAGGDVKKHIHLPTLSAHMGKAGARHGYMVELTKAEDEPLNITGGVM